jgi:hypothetical protein
VFFAEVVFARAGQRTLNGGELAGVQQICERVLGRGQRGQELPHRGAHVLVAEPPVVERPEAAECAAAAEAVIAGRVGAESRVSLREAVRIGKVTGERADHRADDGADRPEVHADHRAGGSIIGGEALPSLPGSRGATREPAE